MSAITIQNPIIGPIGSIISGIICVVLPGVGKGGAAGAGTGAVAVTSVISVLEGSASVAVVFGVGAVRVLDVKSGGMRRIHGAGADEVLGRVEIGAVMFNVLDGSMMMTFGDRCDGSVLACSLSCVLDPMDMLVFGRVLARRLVLNSA
jgi:hypothetical protein